MNDSPYILSYNEYVVGKDEEAIRHHNNDFMNVEADFIDNDSLMTILGVKGYCTCYILKDHTKGRKGDNVVGARVIQMDFDNTWSPEEALEDDFYQAFGVGLYSTASFGKIQEEPSETKLRAYTDDQREVVLSRVGKPKNNFRLVFLTESLVTNELITPLLYGLLQIYPMADVSTKDNARIFYGSPFAELLDIKEDGRFIDNETTRMLIVEGMKYEAVEAPMINSSFKLPSVKSELMIKMKNGHFATTTELFFEMREGETRPCYSPFRTEKSPSAFVAKRERGIFIHDSASREQQFVFVQ